MTLNTPGESVVALWQADWRRVAAVIEVQRRPGERILLTAWDETPVQYYLGETATMEPDYVILSETAPGESYLIVVSHFTTQPPPDGRQEVVFHDAREEVKVLRWFPE